MPETILIVDDDSLIRRSLSASLTQAGYQTLTAGDAGQAQSIVRTQPPDLVLLDIGLPGMDGLEALRALRALVPTLPIIYVTARRRELDEIVGLESGADDYITKPFDLDVLLAHIKAVLRRFRASPLALDEQKQLTVNGIHIDVASRQVLVDGKVADLSPREFDLLLLLARNADSVLTTEQIFEQVWGSGWIGENQTLYVHIRWLREKIEVNPAAPQRLVTVRGIGYKLTS